MVESPTPPLKRHPTLQPLSRDHYVGLVQGRRLMQAAAGNDADRRAAVAAFLDGWDAEIAVHFADEERLLAPVASPADRDRLHKEHERLRSLVDETRQRRRQVDPGADWVLELGQTLTDHIRWEERELFPAIEAAQADELNALHSEAEQIESSRQRGRGNSQRA